MKRWLLFLLYLIVPAIPLWALVGCTSSIQKEMQFLCWAQLVLFFVALLYAFSVPSK